MPRVVSKGEKLIVYGFFILVDVAQFIVDLFVVDEFINNVADFFIGGLLLWYGNHRKLWTGNKLMVLLATFIGEQVPFVNALPFWTLDVKNMYSGTLSEEPPVHGQLPHANTNGVRQPRRPAPLNQNGIRLPSGN